MPPVSIPCTFCFNPSPSPSPAVFSRRLFRGRGVRAAAAAAVVGSAVSKITTQALVTLPHALHAFDRARACTLILKQFPVKDEESKRGDLRQMQRQDWFISEALIGANLFILGGMQLTRVRLA